MEPLRAVGNIPDVVPPSDDARTESQQDRDTRLAIRDVYESARSLHFSCPQQGRIPMQEYLRLRSHLMHRIRIMDINFGIRD